MDKYPLTHTEKYITIEDTILNTFGVADSRHKYLGAKVVGCPKTIDNDLALSLGEKWREYQNVNLVKK